MLNLRISAASVFSKLPSPICPPTPCLSAIVELREIGCRYAVFGTRASARNERVLNPYAVSWPCTISSKNPPVSTSCDARSPVPQENYAGDEQKSHVRQPGLGDSGSGVCKGRSANIHTHVL